MAHTHTRSFNGREAEECPLFCFSSFFLGLFGRAVASSSCVWICPGGGGGGSCPALGWGAPSHPTKLPKLPPSPPLCERKGEEVGSREEENLHSDQVLILLKRKEGMGQRGRKKDRHRNENQDGQAEGRYQK